MKVSESVLVKINVPVGNSVNVAVSDWVRPGVIVPVDDGVGLIKTARTEGLEERSQAIILIATMKLIAQKKATARPSDLVEDLGIIPTPRQSGVNYRGPY